MHSAIAEAIPITFVDYLELVDSTGRCIRDDKRGFISDISEKAIHTLGLNPEQWITHVKNFSSLYASNAGSKETLKTKSKKDNKSWYKGVGLVS